MLTYLEYAFSPAVYVTATFSVCLGLIYGLGSCIGEPWKKKPTTILVSVVMWVVMIFPMMTYSDYRIYRNHYTTCAKPAAVEAKYFFFDNRCYKPVSTGYLQVTETVKQKEDILNGK